MKFSWSTAFKICWVFLSIYLVAGLMYRLIYLQGVRIDLNHFIAYSSVAVLLLGSDRALKHLVFKIDNRTTSCVVLPTNGGEFQELRDESLGILWGILVAVARFPIVFVITPPLGALRGQRWAYEFDKPFLKLLGLSAVTDLAHKLALFSAWYLIGTLLIYLSVCFLLDPAKQSDRGS